MPRLPGLTTTLLLILLSLPTQAAEPWRLASDEDGIQVYLQDVAHSNYQSFRGVALIKADVRTLSDLQENLRVACKWLYACADMRLLKVEDDNTWVYLTTALPWPATTRDMVLKVQTERNDDGSLIRHLSAVPGMVPRESGQIRVTQLQGTWRMIPKGERETEVTYELQAEPAGDIPAWLANRFVIDAPTITLKTLRAVAERQGIHSTDEPTELIQ